MKKFEVELPDDSASRFDQLMKTCETESPSDIFKNALRLFENVVKLTEEGHTFSSTKDGETKPFKPFG